MQNVKGKKKTSFSRFREKEKRGKSASSMTLFSFYTKEREKGEQKNHPLRLTSAFAGKRKRKKGKPFHR